MTTKAQSRRRLGAGLLCLATLTGIGVSCVAPVDEAEQLGLSLEPLTRSTNPPGGLSASQVPQFVAVTFDDNFGATGMQWATNLFTGKKNPAGSGNAGTFDDTKARTTFFHNTWYVQDQKSLWKVALDAGHEVGDHTHSHGDGFGYTLQKWKDEIQLCQTQLAAQLPVPVAEIQGFRSPFLHYTDDTFTALEVDTAQNPKFVYDSSIMGCWAGTEGATSCPWPYTLDNGSADANTLAAERGGRPVGSHTGLWEVPVSVGFVPDDSLATQYGFTSGLRARVAAKLAEAGNPTAFEQSSGKLIAMDITMFYEADMRGPEVLATLKYTLDRRLASGSNRAPFVFVAHAHVYETWSDEWHVPASLDERRAAIQGFVDYALGKSEVRMRPLIDVVNWMKNPVALGETPPPPPDADRTEGGDATASSDSVCNTSTEMLGKLYDNVNTTKWCIRVTPSAGVPLSTAYDFVGSDTYVVTKYTITSGNDAPERDPRDWTFQGCPTSSCGISSDAGWVTLDTRSNEFASAGRRETKTYTFSNASAYQKYRLRITANRGATGITQISEIQMFGAKGSPTCVPTTCAAQGKNCGSIDDGCGNNIACGSCSGGQTCGGGGTPNVCGGCVPTTCAAQGATCGNINNQCGGVLQCGSCVSPQTCGGGGTANMCGGGTGSCSGTVPSYEQGKCNATLVYNGALYRCVSQAVNVAGETVGCGNAAIRCSQIKPDGPWGTDAWQFVQSCP